LTTTSSRKAKNRPTPKKRKTRSTDLSSPAAAPAISSRTAKGRARLALLGLGSNVGNRRAHIERALDEISRTAPILATSSFYRTEPVGFSDQPAFWNVVAAISWPGVPEALLALTRRIEKIVGRTPSFRNGPREIDVDVLDLEGVRRNRPDLVLPHPRLGERRFVLEPLREIAPGWRHPASGKSAAELLRELPRRPPQGVRRLSSRPRGSLAPLPGGSGLR
jgi:2-amino-4-hydroxy-6-hydroxymethyldihydropteridine diphosphokinase